MTPSVTEQHNGDVREPCKSTNKLSSKTAEAEYNWVWLSKNCVYVNVFVELTVLKYRLRPLTVVPTGQ